MKNVHKQQSPHRGARRVLLAMDMSHSSERRAGIADYAKEAGWILETRLGAFLAQGQHEQYLKSAHVDGVLSMLDERTKALLPALKKARVPIVDLWNDPATAGLPHVLLDHYAIGAMGAEHLLGCGLTELLFYSHTLDRGVAGKRCEGFTAVAKSRRARVNELWWDSKLAANRSHDRIEWLAKELKRVKGPLGVMAVNDAVAGELIDAAEYAGLRIPDDIAIVGVDNDAIMTELGKVPLSSIDNARHRAGYEAAALLDRLMKKEVKPSALTAPILIKPAGVVARRSTEVLITSDVDIAGALRFIRDHYKKQISVGDVVSAGLLSRRRMQDRIREATGHSIWEEITRQRLLAARHLLSHSDQKLDLVARNAGFLTGQQMSKVFRRVLKTTPGKYRQDYRQ